MVKKKKPTEQMMERLYKRRRFGLLVFALLFAVSIGDAESKRIKVDKETKRFVEGLVGQTGKLKVPLAVIMSPHTIPMLIATEIDYSGSVRYQPNHKDYGIETDSTAVHEFSHFVDAIKTHPFAAGGHYTTADVIGDRGGDIVSNPLLEIWAIQADTDVEIAWVRLPNVGEDDRKYGAELWIGVRGQVWEVDDRGWDRVGVAPLPLKILGGPGSAYQAKTIEQALEGLLDFDKVQP